MNRRLLVVGAAAAAAGTGFALWGSRSAFDEAGALWDLQFEQPDGGRLVMASLRGRPLLLNFWATWCAPCVKEMPMLDRFHREHRARGWQVVGLAVDQMAPVREFLDRLPMSFPIGLAGMGGVELSRSLGNRNAALPFTIVFDRTGRVLDRKLGAIEAEDLTRWASRGA
jgi:thiol-disulfide isomerase/thioredoxin